MLQRQLADREAHGTALRIGGAQFPQVKTLEEFNLGHQRSLCRDILAHLSTTAWIGKAWNVVLPGPPGVGKTHLVIGLGARAVRAGCPVLFDTAANWISRLTAARNTGRLEQELKRLRRYRLLVIDKIGYLASDHDAANLFFQLVAARSEQGTILVTSNMPFGRWGEIFSDDIADAAMIDRLAHHAEVITLTGDSYRTRSSRRGLLARCPRPRPNKPKPNLRGQFSLDGRGSRFTRR